MQNAAYQYKENVSAKRRPSTAKKEDSFIYQSRIPMIKFVHKSKQLITVHNDDIAGLTEPTTVAN